MRRYLAAITVLAVMLLANTFGGLSFFGMGSTHAMAGVECVNHCLSMLPTAEPAQMPVLALILLLPAVVMFVVLVLAPATNPPMARSLREGIGKIFLRQRLATVILRD